jgi:hypothetical protein
VLTLAHPYFSPIYRDKFAGQLYDIHF